MDETVGRPIPPRDHAVSFSAAIQSESTAILTYLLNNTTPQELHERILKALRGRMMLPTDADTLLLSLRSVGFVTSAAAAAARDENARHCVRCHSVYFERNNGLRACIVSHDKPQLVKNEKSGDDIPGPEYLHFYACCNKSIDTGVPMGSYPHALGRHTTMQENVHYNATNVLTCQQRNCGGNAARPPFLPQSK